MESDWWNRIPISYVDNKCHQSQTWEQLILVDVTINEFNKGNTSVLSKRPDSENICTKCNWRSWNGGMSQRAHESQQRQWCNFSPVNIYILQRMPPPSEQQVWAFHLVQVSVNQALWALCVGPPGSERSCSQETVGFCPSQLRISPHFIMLPSCQHFSE